MIAAYIFLAAFFLIALARTISHYADRVIDEVLAAELRQIDRERRQREYEANVAAYERLGKSANR